MVMRRRTLWSDFDMFTPEFYCLIQPAFSLRANAEAKSMRHAGIQVKRGVDTQPLHAIQPAFHHPPVRNAVPAADTGISWRIVPCVMRVSCILHDNRAWTRKISLAKGLGAV